MNTFIEKNYLEGNSSSEFFYKIILRRNNLYLCIIYLFITIIYLPIAIDIKLGYYLMRGVGTWAFNFLRGRKEIIY